MREKKAGSFQRRRTQAPVLKRKIDLERVRISPGGKSLRRRKDHGQWPARGGRGAALYRNERKITLLLGKEESVGLKGVRRRIWEKG